MTKYYYFILIYFGTVSIFFSQEIKILTQFSQDGELYKHFDNKAQVLAQFEMNEDCFVLSYEGKDKYKVQYKDWTGFVDSQNLIFNDEIDDLFYEFQETERLKLIKQEELRKSKIQAIVNKGDAEVQQKIKEEEAIAKRQEVERLERAKQDSIAEVLAKMNQISIEKEALALKKEAEQKERAIRDSIAQVKALEQQRLVEQEVLARRQEAERLERVKQDSIAQVRAAEQQRLIEKEALTRRLEAERLERVKQDSIAEVLAKMNQIAIEKEALALKKEAEQKERVKQDSIAQVKAAEQQRLVEQEALARRQETERLERAKQDSIAQVRAAEQQRLVEQEALARRQEAERLERAKQDSIAQVRAADQQRLKEQEALARRLETERLERTKQDSITQIKAANAEPKTVTVNQIEDERAEKERLERITFRNTCHYAMNEFDAIDRIKILRTDPYQLTKNMTVELFKRGRATNVFFNLKEDLGCASYLPNNRSYVKIKLENNHTITFYHSWDMDCGDFSFKGIISNSQMSLLEKSPIKSVYLKGTKYSREITTIEYKEFFMDKLKCIE